MYNGFGSANAPPEAFGFYSEAIDIGGKIIGLFSKPGSWGERIYPYMIQLAGQFRKPVFAYWFGELRLVQPGQSGFTVIYQGTGTDADAVRQAVQNWVDAHGPALELSDDQGGYVAFEPRGSGGIGEGLSNMLLPLAGIAALFFFGR